MSHREDYKLMNSIAKKHKEVLEWRQLPLIYLTEHSIDTLGIQGDKAHFSDIINLITLGMHSVPVEEFVFISPGQTTLFGVRTIVDFEADKRICNGCLIDTFIHDKSIGPHSIHVKVSFFYDEKEITVSMEDEEDFLRQIPHITEDTDSVIDRLKQLICNDIMNVFYIIGNIESTDLHPVERISPLYKQVTKRGKAKRKVVGQQRSIVYLNRLPVHYVGGEAKPRGTHASPKYHYRRGHERTLRNDKFRNHPDYMKPKWIKPMWVGARETIIDGVTYKVM